MSDTVVGSKQPKSFEVSFQKSNFFRVVHVDGIYGGSTPKGLLHCAFYSERSAIPKQSVVTIDLNTGAASETVTETRKGVVREIETDVMMDLNNALSFSLWLNQQVELLRAALNVGDDAWATMQQAAQPANLKPL